MYGYDVSCALASERQASLLAQAEAARLVRRARQGPRHQGGPGARRPLLRWPRSLRRELRTFGATGPASRLVLGVESATDAAAGGRSATGAGGLTARRDTPSTPYVAPAFVPRGTGSGGPERRFCQRRALAQATRVDLTGRAGPNRLCLLVSSRGRWHAGERGPRPGPR